MTEEPLTQDDEVKAGYLAAIAEDQPFLMLVVTGEDETGFGVEVLSGCGMTRERAILVAKSVAVTLRLELGDL